MKNITQPILTHAALWALYNSFTSVYLAAYALALGASNLEIGLLGSLPWLAAIITQIPGAQLVQHFTRKNITITMDFFSRLCWLPILFAPFLSKYPLTVVTIFYFFSELTATATSPAFNSLLADIIPHKKRGDIISLRQRTINLYGTIAMVLAGLWLKQFPKESPDGFALMFGSGILLGLFGLAVIRKFPEPPYRDMNHHKLRDYVSVEGQYRTFITFSVAFSFAYMLASPFFAVYMLKDLNMNYFFYGLASALTPLAKIVFSHPIGLLTDKYGDKPIALLGALGIAIVPISYLLATPSTIWIIVPLQIFSGIAWAMSDITTYNLLFDLTDPAKRAVQIAQYNLYTSVPRVIAPIIGGFIVDNAVFILSGIPLIFLISGFVRAISVYPLFKLKEPRARKEYSIGYVLQQAAHFHPNKGLVEIPHGGKTKP